MRTTGRLIGAAVVALLLLAGCSSSSDGASEGTSETTTATSAVPAEPIRILVTNDDGVGAPGIDALVEGLRTLEGVEVTVVAPAENQSGKGGTVTGGVLVASDATTASGYAAKAVAGTPADTIVWAIDQKGIDFTPDLVLSGINSGQNMGTATDLSGTVGAARAAVARGIPALASSMGPLAGPWDWPSGRQYVLDWLEANMDAIAAGTLTTTTVANLNIPTCTTGEVRGQIEVPAATNAEKYNDPADCTSTATDPTDDIAAYLIGFAPLSELSATPAAAG